MREEEEILVWHQKAKHFKCHVCHKNLSTASGMLIHVLQVHKETVTKVPNAKPGRESTDIEIYGMQGIPPDFLGSSLRGESYNPASTSCWLASSSSSPTLVPSSSSCFSSTCTIGIGTAASISCTEYEASHATHCSAYTSTVFAYRTSRTASSYSATPIPVSQPLSPVVASNSIPTQSLPFSAPLLSTNIAPSTPAELKSSIDASNNAAMASNYHTPGIKGGTLVNSHSYASGPNTGGPSIGPPPVIANKAPAIQPEVYLVWDDEAMYMEERRNVLAQR